MINCSSTIAYQMLNHCQYTYIRFANSLPSASAMILAKSVIKYPLNPEKVADIFI